MTTAQDRKRELADAARRAAEHANVKAGRAAGFGLRERTTAQSERSRRSA